MGFLSQCLDFSGTSTAPHEEIMASDLIKHISDDSFESDVLKAGKPVLVDYWAAWCGPCRTMAPQFEAAAAQVPGVRFAKVDTEAAPDVSGRHAIRSIPTMVLYRGGREVARRSGAMPAGEIVSWLRAQQAG